ncbi:general transcription factor IIF subunit 2-like [Olea europaea subsp. europaea]|uniref:General transcription factor IIF subunit 2-like n=2 Tax=Olea europaea subsp. europaea TaxID=158383 RepID=A0A8S0V0S4_OLEEU|nr:general transcription factor IIF subunit 2-like [Olea europaea subsp. europaea]
MELAGNAYGNIPKCYSMDMSTDFVPMSIFSESSQGKKLSVEGKIYHKFDMKPHNENMEDYAKLCRERTNKYMTRTRQTQFIDDDSEMHMRMRPMLGTVDSKPSGSSDKRKMPMKGSEMKRTRRDPEEMEKILFKLFERQPNWTLKQLILETDQPEQFLKNMLKLLCIYNNKGANQGTYELKPEYKRSEDKSDSQ